VGFFKTGNEKVVWKNQTEKTSESVLTHRVTNSLLGQVDIFLFLFLISLQKVKTIVLVKKAEKVAKCKVYWE
jgi:hypothetical protein